MSHRDAWYRFQEISCSVGRSVVAHLLIKPHSTASIYIGKSFTELIIFRVLQGRRLMTSPTQQHGVGSEGHDHILSQEEGTQTGYKPTHGLLAHRQASSPQTGY